MMKMEMIVVFLCVGFVHAQTSLNTLTEVLIKIKTMDETVKALQDEVKELKSMSEVSKVAFSASLSSIIGPYSNSENVIYKHVFINTGDAYDVNTGIFTAPMKGVYAFSLFSKANTRKDKPVFASLYRNDKHEISTYAELDSGFSSSSNGASLLLEKGDKVNVKINANSVLHDNEYHHCTFSGNLLFPM